MFDRLPNVHSALPETEAVFALFDSCALNRSSGT